MSAMTSPNPELLAQLRTCLDAGDDGGVVRLMVVLRRTRRGRRSFHSLEKAELLGVLAACRRHDVAAVHRARIEQAVLVAS
jgi:hypothetical protein